MSTAKQGKPCQAFLAVLCSALAGLMCVSAIMVVRSNEDYQRENFYHQVLLAYKPDSAGNEVLPTVNESLVELQSRYPDVVGWLTIPGTQIDYPFVQGEDNDEYLRADLDHNYLVSGTLFLDEQAQPDFTDFNTVIYGHHMKNESMFGSLPQFRKSDVFAQYPTGILQLPYDNYELEIFASVLTHRYDSVIYNGQQSTAEEKQAFLDYVREKASQYREIEAGVEDHFVTLSTCSYEFSDARTVLVARLVER